MGVISMKTFIFHKGELKTFNKLKISLLFIYFVKITVSMHIKNPFYYIIHSFFYADSESEICFSRSPLVFELQKE